MIVLRSTARLALIPLLFLLGPRAAQATIFVIDSSAPLAAQADAIALGAVRAVTARWENGRIVSDVQLDVAETIKGEPAQSITLVAPGGKIGDVAMRVIGAAEFHVGDRSIVFLSKRQGVHRLLGLAAGKLDVRARDGRELVAWRSGRGAVDELPLALVVDELRALARGDGAMKRLATALLVLSVATPASAFVRSQTSTGTPISWRGQCPELKLGGADNPQVSTQRLRAALAASASAWNGPTQSCSSPRLVIEGAPASVGKIGYDHTNVILWRLPGFCDAAENQKDDVCSAPNAAAVTTVFYIDKPGDAHDGELLEADMELNAVDFQFSDDGAADKVDLGNTLTHELGHVLGLDHTCYTVPGSAPPSDSAGNPVPHCFPLSALPPSATQATMFTFESPGEIDKRVPTADETAGLCSIYVGHDAVCSGSGSGCSVVPAARALPIGLMLLCALFLGLRRAWRRSP